MTTTPDTRSGLAAARNPTLWTWTVDIVLAVGAALIHLPIREVQMPARRLAAAG